MDTHQIAHEELDIKTNGKDAFKVFYRENRPDIFRGEEGVEFPILFAGQKIYQGVGIILASLMADDRLDGFVTRSQLSHGWISGLTLSAKPLSDGREFLCLLRFLKEAGLMIQLETDGRNSLVLETILKEKLIHDLVFRLRGPAQLYEPLTGMALSQEELVHSLSLLTDSIKYKIVLPLSALIRTTGEEGYLTPEEAAGAAAFVVSATHNKKHPFFIEPVLPAATYNIPPLPPAALFKYRTACRRHLLLCEIL